MILFFEPKKDGSPKVQGLWGVYDSRIY